MVWPYLLFRSPPGLALPVQFGINAQLASWLDSPVRAAFVSFLTGAIILAVTAALRFKPLPSTGRLDHGLGHAPWWVWVGGAFGAFYVAGSIVAAPRLGAAALIAVIVAGQSVASVVVDHFGWVGFEPRHVSAGRLVGMALVLPASRSFASSSSLRLATRRRLPLWSDVRTWTPDRSDKDRGASGTPQL